MTVAEAKSQLELTTGYLHFPEDSFSIYNGRLQSKNGVMDIPVEKLIAIVPAHGTVMAIWPREEDEQQHEVICGHVSDGHFTVPF